MTRRVLLVAVAWAAAALPASLAAQPPHAPTPVLPDIGPPPGRLVDVGGRRLHLLCAGVATAGAPTVVLEAGASAFAIDWTLVQRAVARTHRVCAYDRAGSGWSDPPTPGAPPVETAHDLRALLRAAGEAPPYLLVGASLGGPLVRVYQADFPAEVAGLVLVDPSTEEGLFALVDGAPRLIASLSAEELRRTIPERPVAVPRRPPQRGAPFDRLPPALYALRLRLDERLIASVPDTVPHAIVLAFAERDRARLARLRALRERAAHPLGALPVVVLTRGVSMRDGLRESHERVARLSTRGRHAVVAGAGHEIHLHAPETVVRAIAEVAAARTGAPH